MKKLLFILIITPFLILISCNNNKSSSKEDHSMMNHDESMPMQGSTSDNKDIKVVSAMFGNVDPGVSSYMKMLTQHYLAIKNALVNSDASGAASSAGKMFDEMKKFDKSLLTAEQKKVYDEMEDDLKEHAEHISKSKLDHQRDHFAMMSEDMYDMVNAFGTGMILYHDHCPMYKNGSLWLSETEDIRNPYYGNKMMSCGSVEEVLQ